MLVLSRKQGEVIVAGDVEITVVAIQGNRVQLGLNAPDTVVISRKEVIERAEKEGWRNPRMSGDPADV